MVTLSMAGFGTINPPAHCQLAIMDPNIFLFLEKKIYGKKDDFGLGKKTLFAKMKSEQNSW